MGKETVDAQRQGIAAGLPRRQFKISRPAPARFYKNAVDRVSTRDPYAAMLMAMHGVALMNAGYGKYAYPPDRTGDPRVKAYVDHQEELRLKLLEQLRQSEEFKQHCSDEQVWTNYEYMEVFDQLAQFVCNRHPLNSKA